MLSGNPHTAVCGDLSPATPDAVKFRDKPVYSLLPWLQQRKSNGGYGILVSTRNNSLFKISLGSTLTVSGCQQNEERGRVETTE